MPKPANYPLSKSGRARPAGHHGGSRGGREEDRGVGGGGRVEMGSDPETGTSEHYIVSC